MGIPSVGPKMPAARRDVGWEKILQYGCHAARVNKKSAFNKVLTFARDRSRPPSLPLSRARARSVSVSLSLSHPLSVSRSRIDRLVRSNGTYAPGRAMFFFFPRR